MPAAIERTRLPVWRGIFYLLMALGPAILFVKMTQGIGAVSNLSDEFPWGLWVGFDVLCGIGLASGGFVITAAVYVFDLKRFRPIVRPALLTAFIGYVLEVAALMFDLGRPWNLWRPIVNWNPDSVMFVVAWCVILYSTVMALEMSGMLFERIGWKKALKAQQLVSLPLVIAGVVLSMVHQSSLGSLYLIVPGKLHALWYTDMLPLLFFVSAVMAGLAMLIVESHLSSRALKRHLEMDLLVDIGQILAGVMVVYAGLRFYDLWSREQLAALFAFDYESLLALLELGPLTLLPLVLFASPKVRANTHWMYGSALLVVFGFVVNRLNVSVTGLESAQGMRYIPSIAEAGVTLFLIALGFGLFRLAVIHLPVFPEEHSEEVPAFDPPDDPAPVPPRAPRRAPREPELVH